MACDCAKAWTCERKRAHIVYVRSLNVRQGAVNTILNRVQYTTLWRRSNRESHTGIQYIEIVQYWQMLYSNKKNSSPKLVTIPSGGNEVQLRHKKYGITTWVCTNSPTASAACATEKLNPLRHTKKLEAECAAQRDYSGFHLPLYFAVIGIWESITMRGTGIAIPNTSAYHSNRVHKRAYPAIQDQDHRPEPPVWRL